MVVHVFGIDERTLLRWINTFNARGIDGLLGKCKPGRPRKITPDDAQTCRRLLDQPEEAGRTHRTAVRFHGYLRDELDIEVGYSAVPRFLHDSGYRLKVAQPWSDRQDEAARQAFRTRLGELVGRTDKRDVLVARLDKALAWLINRRDGNLRTCAIPT